jgi:hypothetical protein
MSERGLIAAATTVFRCVSRTKWVLTVALVLAGIPTLVSLFGQSAIARGKVYSVEGETADGLPASVVVRDLANRQTREFFRPQDGHVFDLRIAPSGELVAVTTRLLKFGANAQEATTILNGKPLLEAMTLWILSSAGTQIDAIPGVRLFEWSPDSQHIVYVTGDYRGSLYSEPVNTKTWVWDLADKRRTMITDGGSEVSWAKFDNNIYIWNHPDAGSNRVLMYDTSTGGLVDTKHVSIFFSPSGQYYYHPGPHRTSGRENVYLSNDTGLEATSRVLRTLNGWTPLGWAPDSDLLLMDASRKADTPSGDEKVTIVYNPREDTSVDVGAADGDARSKVVGWGENSDELIIRGEGTVDKKAMTDFRQR